ncbi:exodeoxyribonuclease V subunit alpha [Halomonas cibimaris]|uniref:RecBCD enzyme subunit RecD n=1 Tax=Halomonas cibimaris TaxID=657012 RepID=A0ABP7L2A6_9GAMM
MSHTDDATLRLARAPYPSADQALTDNAALLGLLFAWAEYGWIRDLDAALAHRLAQLAPEAEPAGLLAAMLVSHQAGQGHLLLDLERARRAPESLLAVSRDDGAPPPPEALIRRLPAGWADALRRWSAVGEGPGNTPLVLEDDHLYLRRYWRHEQQVSRGIAARLTPAEAVEPAGLRPVLDVLFPPDRAGAERAGSQKLACALGARAPFTVITGGPGTGKTTTVIRLLALLQVQAISERGAPLAVRLAAPTGKAAARLSESISGQIQALDALALPHAVQVQAAIPHEVATLHRLLGARPGTRHFHHHRRNPLALDMVAVDEASMVDIDMMAALLDALPPHARLVLLGDKDQLASVEAGAVLGSLCARAEAGHYQPAISRWLAAATGMALPAALEDSHGRPLDQAVAMLRHSFRFDDASGIGRLARAVNAGDSARALAVLDDDAYPEVQQQTQGLMTLALDGTGRPGGCGYRHYLGGISAERPAAGAAKADWDRWAAGVLKAHAQFQLLTPLRTGPYGVDALNPRIEQALARAGLIARPARAAGAQPNPWYEGRPVLVTGNDYSLKLMNGDIGIALAVPAEFNREDAAIILRVAFPAGDGQGGIRWVLPSRLQQVETVYAMTVHKSQGSEFVHTALVMPDAPSPILTRELVYTAVTRARQTFTLLSASTPVVEGAVRRRIARQSRLFTS